jgi:hypothetical protein
MGFTLTTSLMIVGMIVPPPKWAYYLYPDHFQDTTCVPNDLESIMVREGDTVTYAGVKVSLEYSDDELDYVRIERAKD